MVKTSIDMITIPQLVIDEMPLAAQMIEIPRGKRIFKTYPHAEVAVAPIIGGLGVRVIWWRSEAYSDQGDGDGTGSIREVEQADHAGWSDALFVDLASAIRAARSMDPGSWRRHRRASQKPQQ